MLQYYLPRLLRTINRNIQCIYDNQYHFHYGKDRTDTLIGRLEYQTLEGKEEKIFLG